MKIAMVTPYDLASSGGVNSYARTLTAWLRGEGHSVDLIGPAAAGATVEDGIVIGRSRRVWAGATRVPITLSPRAGRRIGAAFQRAQYDLIHIHEPFMPLGSLLALRRSDAATLGTFHGSERVGRLGYRIAAPLLRRWARRLDACTAVSATALRAARPFADAAEVIPCPVDRARFAAPLPPPPAMPPGRRYVLFVGRADKRKGLRTLLRAFELLHSERPDVYLIVAGRIDKPMQGLRSRVGRGPLASAVTFVDQVEQAALPAYYQHADLFCSPATGGESFGIVLAEAMAASTPIVATEIDGYTDIVKAEREAVLVPTNDVGALAKGLARVLEDGPLADRLPRAGRNRVREFDVAAVGHRHLDLYHRTVQGRRG
jgi:phosphatidylinositol alpha-mannosyltransferase